MKVLGLDLSLTSTGWVVIDDASQEIGQVAAAGTQSFPRLREVERLQAFDVWISDLLEKQKPDYVGIEGYAYGMRSGSTHAFAIGELGGLIKTSIAYEKIPMSIVPPATWKKALCGKGNLAKDEVRLELFKRYGVEFPTQDALDAWAVATCVRRQLLGIVVPAPKQRSRKAMPATVIESTLVEFPQGRLL